MALNSIDKTTAEHIRDRFALALKRQVKGKQNLTKPEILALRNLRNNKSIVISKANKGNSTAVMDKCDYFEKINEHIRSGPYQEIKKPIDMS